MSECFVAGVAVHEYVAKEIASRRGVAHFSNFVCENAKIVVVFANAQMLGCESISDKGGGYDGVIQHLREHIAAVRREIPWTARLHVVLIMEGNLTQELPVDVARNLRATDPLVVPMYSVINGGQRTPSVITTHGRKEQMASILNTYLLTNLVRWYAPFVSVCSPRRPAHKFVDEIRRQFRSYMKVFVPVATAGNVSAGSKRLANDLVMKLSGKGSGPDDIIMALQIGLYFASLFEIGERRERLSNIDVGGVDYFGAFVRNHQNIATLGALSV